MTAREHNKLLGIFLMVQGGLQLFGGLFAVLIYGGMGLAFLGAGRGDEQVMGGIFLVMAAVFVPIMLAFAGLFLLAGWKMLKEKTGARNWGIAASIVALLGFPLGTVLGIYGLWFLLGDQGKNFYLAGGLHNQNMFNPPPPNNWR
jgi:hypothetical protein